MCHDATRGRWGETPAYSQIGPRPSRWIFYVPASKRRDVRRLAAATEKPLLGDRRRCARRTRACLWRSQHSKGKKRGQAGCPLSHSSWLLATGDWQHGRPPGVRPALPAATATRQAEIRRGPSSFVLALSSPHTCASIDDRHLLCRPSPAGNRRGHRRTKRFFRPHDWTVARLLLRRLWIEPRQVPCICNYHIPRTDNGYRSEKAVGRRGATVERQGTHRYSSSCTR